MRVSTPTIDILAEADENLIGFQHFTCWWIFAYIYMLSAADTPILYSPFAPSLSLSHINKIRWEIYLLLERKDGKLPEPFRQFSKIRSRKISYFALSIFIQIPLKFFKCDMEFAEGKSSERKISLFFFSSTQLFHSNTRRERKIAREYGKKKKTDSLTNFTFFATCMLSHKWNGVDNDGKSRSTQFCVCAKCNKHLHIKDRPSLELEMMYELLVQVCIWELWSFVCSTSTDNIHLLMLAHFNISIFFNYFYFHHQNHSSNSRVIHLLAQIEFVQSTEKAILKLKISGVPHNVLTLTSWNIHVKSHSQMEMENWISTKAPTFTHDRRMKGKI